MDSLLTNAKDVAAIGFGATAFVISLATLVRSILTERRTRHHSLKQKQQDAVKLGAAVWLSLIKVKSSTRDVHDEAAEEGYTDLAETLEPLIEGYEKQLKIVDVILAEIKKTLPKFGTKEWQKVSDEFDLLFVQLQDMADPGISTLEADDAYLHEAKRNLRLKKRLSPA